MSTRQCSQCNNPARSTPALCTPCAVREMEARDRKGISADLHNKLISAAANSSLRPDLAILALCCVLDEVVKKLLGGRVMKTHDAAVFKLGTIADQLGDYAETIEGIQHALNEAHNTIREITKPVQGVPLDAEELKLLMNGLAMSMRKTKSDLDWVRYETHQRVLKDRVDACTVLHQKLLKVLTA